ncbi:acyltransferase [Streptomyces sp. ODS28]|uniref:acyltransferase family protein n=1 Tax=Streptomyces sp. ODS28 TaxID=3136688 RepID=UPI0031E94D55
MAGAPEGAGRRGELDALRILVVAGLVLFHSSLVFDAENDFYVKNAETTTVTGITAGFGVVWAMPLLFLVGGLGAWYSLRRRGTAGFVRERLLRLGVPLVFATCVLCPLPQWLRERSHHSSYDVSYWHFLPRFFDVHWAWGDFPFVLDGPYFETGHLWFVVVLLELCLLLALLARWLPDGHTLRRVPRAAMALPMLPLAAVCALLGLDTAYGGWDRSAYALFFAAGYVLAGSPALRAAMRRDRWPALVLGLCMFGASAPGFSLAHDPLTSMEGVAVVARALFGATGWCALVALLGFLDRPRRAGAVDGGTAREDVGPHGSPREEHPWRRRFTAYTGPAVLPMYVLHQPIVVAVAYGVVGWSAPIPVKYAVIVVCSLAGTWAAYDVLVRRTRITRFLFGMRRVPRDAGAAPAQ